MAIGNLPIENQVSPRRGCPLAKNIYGPCGAVLPHSCLLGVAVHGWCGSQSPEEVQDLWLILGLLIAKALLPNSPALAPLEKHSTEQTLPFFPSHIAPERETLLLSVPMVPLKGAADHCKCTGWLRSACRVSSRSQPYCVHRRVERPGTGSCLQLRAWKRSLGRAGAWAGRNKGLAGMGTVRWPHSHRDASTFVIAFLCMKKSSFSLP